MRKVSRVILLILSYLLVACLTPQLSAEAKSRELLLGIEPEHNIFDQMLKYRALSEYLSDQLGLEVKLTIMSRYGEVVKRFRSLHLDGAVLSSYTTRLAIDELDIVPMVSLVREDGSTTSRGLLLVRKDSGIENVSDMRGKSVVFVDAATTEGYVFAKAYFRQNGVDDLDSFFSHHYFSGSHASVVYAVLDGRAEIGSAKDTVYEQLVNKDPTIRYELQIVAKSPPVPEVTLCVKRDLDPNLLKMLEKTLLTMDQTIEGHRVLKMLGAKRFTLSGLADFSVVTELVEEAGLNDEGNANIQ